MIAKGEPGFHLFNVRFDKRSTSRSDSSLYFSQGRPHEGALFPVPYLWFHNDELKVLDNGFSMGRGLVVVCDLYNT